MLLRLAAGAIVVAFSSVSAVADTPFASHCEGDVCFQGKVNTGCLQPETRRLMKEIAQRFGKIEIASACDGRHARRSAHYVGKAFDFRPYGGSRTEIIAFLKASPNVGGVGTYPNGLIHADVADRKMAWHGRGGRAWPIFGLGPSNAPAQPVVPVQDASVSAFPGLAASFAEFLKGPDAPKSELAAPSLPVANGADPRDRSKGTPKPIRSASAADAPTGGAIPLPPSRPALLGQIPLGGSGPLLQPTTAAKSAGTVPSTGAPAKGAPTASPEAPAADPSAIAPPARLAEAPRDQNPDQKLVAAAEPVPRSLFAQPALQPSAVNWDAAAPSEQPSPLESAPRVARAPPTTPARAAKSGPPSGTKAAGPARSTGAKSD